MSRDLRSDFDYVQDLDSCYPFFDNMIYWRTFIGVDRPSSILNP